MAFSYVPINGSWPGQTGYVAVSPIYPMTNEGHQVNSRLVYPLVNGSVSFEVAATDSIGNDVNGLYQFDINVSGGNSTSFSTKIPSSYEATGLSLNTQLPLNPYPDTSHPGAYVQRQAGTDGVATAPLQALNPKDYGAKGGGTTDDSTAITNWLAACAANNVEGYAPPGTFICNNVSSPAQSTGWIKVRGAGRGATIFKANAAGDHTLKFSMPCDIEDMTVDGGGVATNALELVTAGVSISEMNVRRVSCGNIASAGSWTLIVWDTSQVWSIARVVLDEVELYGPSNTASDAFAVSFVTKCIVNDMKISGVGRTPNFFFIKDLEIDGLDVSGITTGTPAGLVFDSGIQKMRAARITCDSSAGVQIKAVDARIENSTFNSFVACGYQAQQSLVEFHDCEITGNGSSLYDFSGLEVADTQCRVRVFGGRLAEGTGNIGAVAINAATNAIVTGLELHGVILDCPGSGAIAKGTNSPITLANHIVDGCIGLSPGRFVNDGVTNGTTAFTSQTANFTAVDVGRSVTGTNIPANTTISSVTNSTTVVMNNAATGSGTGLVISFGDRTFNLSYSFSTPDGATSRVSGTKGFNPVGTVSPAVPASGSAVAAVHYDRTFYVSTVAGTTACSMAIQNGPTITFVGSVAQVIAVKVPAGKTVTPTYTGTAPTWVVEGE